MLLKIQNIYFHKIQKIKQIIFYLFRHIAVKSLPKTDLALIIYKIKKNLFIPRIIYNQSLILKTAQLAKKSCFYILGEKICFKKSINWHQDFKTTKIIYGWKTKFYRKIKISAKEVNSINEYNPDVKVPWELSRLQHLPSIGKLFIQTKNNRYKKIFIENIETWVDNNTFLIGINWVCPMDVSIRAINIIHGMDYFKYELSESILLKIINSLYQHAIYLENNWEFFYKNNNHYLTDLLGYFYLSFLFDHIKHFKKIKIKIVKRILKQFDEQIMQDGTSYEGSTNYHRLVTEIFILFQKLCLNNKLKLPNNFTKKLIKSKQFIKDCTDYYGNFVQIGDNDSGEIIKNKKRNLENISKLSHYSNFGLTIIKNKYWHITYRHPTYKKNQPNGHFHQDALSITISYKGIPILVDPGTGLYTPNKKMRDKLRSYSSHNNFFIYDESIDNQNIFLLNKKEQTDTSKIIRKKNNIEIENHNKQSQNILFRKLLFNNKNQIEIIDWIENIDSNKKVTWNFIFHPNIKIKSIKKNNINKFLIVYKKNPLLVLKSNLKLKIKKAYYSASYGTIENCYKLYSKTKITHNKIITILEKETKE